MTLSHRYRDPNTLTSREVCPHCRRETTRHGFTTPDGHWLETHHCREHGDVAPMRSVVVNFFYSAPDEPRHDLTAKDEEPGRYALTR